MPYSNLTHMLSQYYLKQPLLSGNSTVFEEDLGLKMIQNKWDYIITTTRNIFRPKKLYESIDLSLKQADRTTEND